MAPSGDETGDGGRASDPGEAQVNWRGGGQQSDVRTSAGDLTSRTAGHKIRAMQPRARSTRFVSRVVRCFPVKEEITGSNPVRIARASGVIGTHHPCKMKDAGSNPVGVHQEGCRSPAYRVRLENGRPARVRGFKSHTFLQGIETRLCYNPSVPYKDPTKRKEYFQGYYRANKQVITDRSEAARLEAREFLASLKEECLHCGYSKCKAALTFHHRDGLTKEFSLATARRLNKERLLAEVAKCDVLCANCHAEEHWA